MHIKMHILGIIRNLMKFDLFISFIISPPFTKTDNDDIPSSVIVTSRTSNISPNKRRLDSN
jgi:hypothetical protein